MFAEGKKVLPSKHQTSQRRHANAPMRFKLDKNLLLTKTGFLHGRPNLRWNYLRTNTVQIGHWNILHPKTNLQPQILVQLETSIAYSLTFAHDPLLLWTPRNFAWRSLGGQPLPKPAIQVSLIILCIKTQRSGVLLKNLFRKKK